jgi:AhpD family alkylhydroperoxidase
MVYLAVASVNECAYCGAHHEKGARAAGLTENEIHEIKTENNQHFAPKEQAALHYARELTRTADAEDTRGAVQELFSPEQVVELTLVVCMANFTNRFNNGLSVPLEG